MRQPQLAQEETPTLEGIAREMFDSPTVELELIQQEEGNPTGVMTYDPNVEQLLNPRTGRLYRQATKKYRS